MWWWQSVAFGGSFILGALVPDDHFTDCPPTPLVHPVAPRARLGIAFSNDRRSRFVMVYLPLSVRHAKGTGWDYIPAAAAKFDHFRAPGGSNGTIESYEILPLTGRCRPVSGKRSPACKSCNEYLRAEFNCSTLDGGRHYPVSERIRCRFSALAEGSSYLAGFFRSCVCRAG
jgi:hypothetical protein